MTEPVAWMYIKKDGMQVITDDPDYADGTWTPLYTVPPKKEWVGLTDKEMFDCLVQTDYAAVRLPLGLKLFAEFIEAKLKEKNA